MQQKRSLEVLQLLQGVDYLFYVISVYRTEISESHSLEQMSSIILDDVGLGGGDGLLDELSQTVVSKGVPDLLLGLVVARVCGHAQQVVVHGSDVPVYRNVVVVQYYEDISLAGSGIVQSLECQTSCQSSVTDEGYSFLSKSLHLCGLGKSQCGRNGGGGMTDPECIIFAFGTLGKSADTVLHAVLAESFTTTGDYLVGIGLVSDVEHELVGRSVEYIVQTDDELHGAEAWSEMSGIDGAAFDHVAADFSTESAQLFHIK